MSATATGLEPTPVIFDPFHGVSRESARSEGLGLGLDIVQQFVRCSKSPSRGGGGDAPGSASERLSCFCGTAARASFNEECAARDLERNTRRTGVVWIDTGFRDHPVRKRVIVPERSKQSCSDAPWLSLGEIASVEITSEDAAHPIESALLPGAQSGWRAADPGAQVIRVCFDQPQQLSRIGLEFNEPSETRTQEYVLRWSGDGGQSFHEIARQQWNFSSPNATCETEEHCVELSAVTQLELVLTPDISGGNVRASLSRLRLA
ncbi:MAG: hypothetical protein ABW034_02400 [Steroidobacteraceae bacterium]